MVYKFIGNIGKSHILEEVNGGVNQKHLAISIDGTQIHGVKYCFDYTFYNLSEVVEFIKSRIPYTDEEKGYKDNLVYLYSNFQEYQVANLIKELNQKIPETNFVLFLKEG